MAGEIVIKNAEPSGGTVQVDFSSSTVSDLAQVETVTGWGSYDDGQYTSASPFSLSANTDTALPNNAATKIETQKPTDVTTFYDGSVITGRNGDAIEFTMDFKIKPTSGAATYVESWIDIGGAIGELYRRINSFPKGSGVERQIAITTLAYTLDTWEANGGTLYVRSNGPCEIYDIRIVIARIHKAR